jgi:hypothetical protein
MTTGAERNTAAVILSWFLAAVHCLFRFFSFLGKTGNRRCMAAVPPLTHRWKQRYRLRI